MHYNGAQWYDQFLHADRLDRPLTLLSFALYHPTASVSSVVMVLCIGYTGVVYTSVTSVYHERLWYNVLIS